MYTRQVGMGHALFKSNITHNIYLIPNRFYVVSAAYMALLFTMSAAWHSICHMTHMTLVPSIECCNIGEYNISIHLMKPC